MKSRTAFLVALTLVTAVAGMILGSTLLAGGLLLVAFLFQWFGDPAQRPIVEMVKAVAALIEKAARGEK